MAGPTGDGKSGRNCEFLLDFVEGYSLFHVRTFRYNDLQEILSIVSENNQCGFIPVTTHDTVTELHRYIEEEGRNNVQLLAIRGKFEISHQTK